MTHDQAVESMAAERYVLDEMPEIERYRFEEHFFECAECGETMRLFQSMRAGAKEVFAGVPAESVSDTAAAPGRPAERKLSLRLVMPYAAAAMLAIGLIHQTWIADRGPAGQALALTMLRPASRGELPAVVLPSSNELVGLAADIDGGSPGEPVTYRITRADGTEVDRKDAVVPAQGTSFVAAVPADRLRAPGPYVLTLTVGESDQPREYRFRTTAQ